MAVSVAPPPHGRASGDRERAAEQPRRVAHVACEQSVADERGAHDALVELHRLDDVDGEAAAGTDAHEAPHVALTLVAEPEVGADDDPPQVTRVDDVPDEL